MKKISNETLLKVGGWVLMAIGGLVCNIASDKEQKKEFEKKSDEFFKNKGV